jgi:hypothetical protein
VGNQLAFFNLPEPFLQAGQKLGFLRDLLEFRASKFWELCHDFVEAHPWILAHLDRVTTLNLPNGPTKRQSEAFCSLSANFALLES